MKIKKCNIRNIVLASFLGVSLLSLLVAPIVSSELSFATGDCGTTSGDEYCNLNVEVTVPEYLSITSATALADLGESTEGAVSVSSAQQVVVATNLAGGYYLTAKAISEDTTGAVSNKLLRRDAIGDTDSTHTKSNDGFSSLTANTAKANIGAGYWGLSLDDSTYRPIATSASGSGIIDYSTGPVAPKITTLYYAAKHSNALLQGDYSATIQYTALRNNGSSKTLYGD